MPLILSLVLMIEAGEDLFQSVVYQTDGYIGKCIYRNPPGNTTISFYRSEAHSFVCVCDCVSDCVNVCVRV